MVLEKTAAILHNSVLMIDELVKKVVPVRHPEVFLAFIVLAIATVLIMRKTFVKFRDRDELNEYNKSRRWIRSIVTIIRIGVFLLLFAALASPFLVQEKIKEGDLSITILGDNSTSFELFNMSVAEKLKSELELAFPATLSYVAQGDHSPIADGMISRLKGDDHMLLVSDGNNNEGKSLRDTIMFLSNMNSTVSMIDLEPLHPDTGVAIFGLEKVIRGTDAPFMARVTQVGQETSYHIKITLGTVAVVDEDGVGSNAYEFSRKLGEGYHKVTAELTVNGDDYFSENNNYYKTVEVLKRPKIMVVSGKESYFYSLLMDIYDFARESAIPGDLSPYTALILNDIPAAEFSPEDFGRLSDFVINGSGLVVYGGKNSYENGGYANSPLESLLPVKSGQSEKEEVKKEDMNIVLLIDVSGSTSASFSAGEADKKVDVEKALALSVLDFIKGENKVGAIAFNTDAYVISLLTPLNENGGDLKEKISKLQEGGGTDIAAGIRDAEIMLGAVKGSKNIILISDGITTSPGEALAQTEKAKRKGISIYTVGVGGDTFELLMKQIAFAGNGAYYRPTQSQRLKIIFGEPEEDDECNDDKRKLMIINPGHFVTDGLELEAFVSGYNYVIPRSTSTSLVATCNGKAIMTVWRYGLGRVVSMSTDDGSAWSGDLLGAKNSEIITRMINWAIGDPTRTVDFKVEAHDANLGEAVRIKVKSKSQPVSDMVSFSKTGDDIYEGEFFPAAVGYYDLLGATVGVSYRKELEKTGMNSELFDLVHATGGEVFGPDDTEEIINKTKSLSRRVETEELDMTWPFLLAALVLFLAEIGIRRIWESRGV